MDIQNQQPVILQSIPVNVSVSKKATIGLILGIIGIFSSIVLIIGVPITIIGLIFGIKGLKTVKRKTAIWAVILCIMGLVLSVMFYTINVSLIQRSAEFIPTNWSKEEKLIRGNEALLYSLGELILESYPNELGYFPDDLNEIAKTYPLSLYKDLSSKKPVRYTLSNDKKNFDLRYTGPDGKFDTNDDIIFDPTRMSSNLLPMYGGGNVVKTPLKLQADKKFIDSLIKIAGSREKASVGVNNGAKEWLEKGDLDTAMKRFNQAWLLDPNNPEPYKGFAEILKQRGDLAGAQMMLDLAKEKESII